MKSTTKKSRKRDRSPDSHVHEQPSPRRVRTDAAQPDTPVEDRVFHRPVTRSSNTPLLSSTAKSSQESSARQSGRKSSRSVSTPAPFDSAAVNKDDVGDQAHVNIEPHSTSSSRRSIVTTQGSGRKAVSRVSGRSLPGNRNIINNPPVITPHTNIQRYSTVEPSDGDSVLVASHEPEQPSPDALEFDGSLDVFIRLSRVLVLLTIFLFACASLLRIDHDKHDTHGSVSRSGRKLYSFLTVGFVQPYEWGVPRSDLSLLYEAEAMMKQMELAVDDQERRGEVVESFLNASGNMVDRLQVAFDDYKPNPKFDSSTNTHDSEGNFRMRHATTAVSPQEMYALLSVVHERIDEQCAGELKILAASSKDLERNVSEIYHAVENVKKSLCTTKSCNLWSAYQLSAQKSVEEIRAIGIDFLCIHKDQLSYNLTALVEQGISRIISTAMTLFIESLFREEDSVCANGTNVEVASCVRNVLLELINSAVYSALPLEKFGNLNSEGGEGVVDDESIERERSGLQLMVYELIISEGVQHHLEVATVHSPSEADIYSRCREYVKNHIKSPAAESSSSQEIFPDSEVLSSGNHGNARYIDYAVAPRGGRVVPSSTIHTASIFTSPPFFPNLLNTAGLLGGHRDASVVISSTLPPERGDCYAFSGSSGNITVILSVPTSISKIGVYHDFVDKSSSIKSFRAYGWPELPSLLIVGKHDVKATAQTSPIHLGDFSMESQRLEMPGAGLFMDFSLYKDGGRAHQIPLQAVTFQFENIVNSAEYTCVYRVQLLAESPDQ